ncbi:MAG: SPOR domain-containing protein [Candidatus Andeanibacterium colombiense]|uniref:SPOR domain-containing protein n=1 Tax=Candidatus Andeanibacterium colombiense TaxID=3121345 RepID=A0AAJ6BN15_9SPHN|nr:MAG: SPOR domain-containing protein [Sphingomonadaceae bacterium]
MPLRTPANGPAADYPITVGGPYTAAGTSYTPADVWNYDEVGTLALDTVGGDTISGSHHTLPIPSYVEVTSLETGRTILVRLERRGPMDGNQLIALSPGALAQLGASASTPVRVRRVNPQEPERAALRSGQSAPARMDTPMSLVNVLRLKLPGNVGPLPVPGAPLAVAAVGPSSAAGLALPPLDAASSAGPPKPVIPKPSLTPAPKPAVKPVSKPAAGPVGSATRGGFVVQAGAFSARDRAEKVAQGIGGKVSPSGRLFRVRAGPYASRQAAEASLAKIRAAGYSDARIYSDD